MKDEFFLKETLKLAKLGRGWTSPNPMVGAVIVKNGKIIGKGYHKRVGFPHAEIEALQSAKGNPKGATLYVNLEPCAHYGRTPPCVKNIINSGIKRVVCCTLDPNPKVHGRGVAILRRTGIKVSVGILVKEARWLNEGFFTFHEKKRPFIALKFASSLDGKIATRTGDSKWITNRQARKYARELRGIYQAVLVGINTAIKDNPHLGVRIRGKKDPLRIILDSHLRIPLKSRVLRDNNVLVATTSKAARKKRNLLEKKGVTVLTFNSSKINLPRFLQELAKKEVISILVEGGGEVLGSFVDHNLLDKVYAFYAPIIIGGDQATSAISGKGTALIRQAKRLSEVTLKRFGDNILVEGKIRYE